MNDDITAIVERSSKRLFPNSSLNQVLADLLLERAQKNLIKYQAATRLFKTKYEQDFDSFRQHILHSESDFEVEQDYFDWELAVTGISDMSEEIKRLQTIETFA
ncbi:MAG: hypothetical protein GWP17_00820 [Aquificales bacterium]|nr:hypothetical protein [Aquificales bacterium]